MPKRFQQAENLYKGDEKKLKKSTLIKVGVVLLIAVFVFVLTRTIRFSGSFQPMTPEETAVATYEWYIEFKGHPLLSGAYKDVGFFSDSFISSMEREIERSGNSLIQNDPILCSGEIPYYTPYTYDAREMISDKDTATVVANLDYYGTLMDVEITMVKDRRRWKIDTVKCPPPPEEPETRREIKW